MRRLYLAFAFFILLVVTAIAWAATSDTLNTVPSSNLSFLSHLQTFLKEEDADRLIEMGGTDFIISGGTHSSGAGLTKTPSAVVAYMRGMRTTESASVTYEDNTICNLSLHKDTTGDIGTYTRVANTHYLLDCDSGGSAPDVVGVLKLLIVTTAGGAVSVVQDDREAGFTTDVPAITTSNGKFANIGGTFNFSGILTAVKINVIDTLSSAASRLLSLQVSDEEKFYVTKEGDVYGTSYKYTDATIACDSGYTSVRGWCMDSSPSSLTNIRIATDDCAGFGCSVVTVVVKAGAKMALIQAEGRIDQDGTGEEAGLDVCIRAAGEASNDCNSPTVELLNYVANSVAMDNNTRMIHLNASGEIGTICFPFGGPVTLTSCSWNLVGYIP